MFNGELLFVISLAYNLAQEENPRVKMAAANRPNEVQDVTQKLEQSKVSETAEISFAGRGLKLNKAEDGELWINLVNQSKKTEMWPGVWGGSTMGSAWQG